MTLFIGLNYLEVLLLVVLFITPIIVNSM